MKTIVTGGAGFLGSHLYDLLLEKGHHNVDTRIVRIFNTYGPRMRAGDGRLERTMGYFQRYLMNSA